MKALTNGELGRLLAFVPELDVEERGPVRYSLARLIAAMERASGQSIDMTEVERVATAQRTSLNKPIILGTMPGHTDEDLERFRRRRDERRRQEAEHPRTLVFHEPERG